MIRSTLLVAVAALLALGACQTTSSQPNADAGESRWVQATGSLEVELDRQAAALPWTHGRDRVELIAWFAAVGEPAYETLLGFLDDDRPEVIATALAALGATGDARLVQPLREAEAHNWNNALKLESARARVRLGDWNAMPTLITGLEAEEPFVRALCLQALTQATRETKGFDPYGTEAERKAALIRWKEWWRAREKEALLVTR